MGIWKVNLSSARSWGGGSVFPVVPFRFTQSIDCKIPLAQSSAKVMWPPNSNSYWIADGNKHLPLEITAPDNLTPMTTSLIFCKKSSLTRLGLLRLLKISDRKYFFWLLNLHFQFLIDICKKEYCGYFDMKRLSAACVPFCVHIFPFLLDMRRYDCIIWRVLFGL